MRDLLLRVWRWWASPSQLAIDFYRAGRYCQENTSGVLHLLTDVVYRIVHPVIEAWTGITLPREAKVGSNLRMFHRGKIVINPDTIIGNNCSIVHGVTIGNRRPGGGAPLIGNDVQIGAYAQLLGPIRIGDNVKIGALALVVKDIPAGSVVMSQSARILP